MELLLERGTKGCLMAYLTPSDALPFIDYAAGIPDEELGEDGRELEPHVTVLYGLLDNDPEPIIDLCRGFGVITATLSLVEAFENDEFDVLKVTVHSDDLKRLNKKISTLEFENDYPEYKPHLTLAYLKSGLAEKYVGDDEFESLTLTFDRVVYSDANKRKTEISLM